MIKQSEDKTLEAVFVSFYHAYKQLISQEKLQISGMVCLNC